MAHCREALIGGIGNSQRDLRLPRLVQRLGDLILQAVGAFGVEIDWRDGQPAAPERHHTGPRLAELDARLLERDEVVERRRDRAEAVLELLAEHTELRHLASPRDAAV